MLSEDQESGLLLNQYVEGKNLEIPQTSRMFGVDDSQVDSMWNRHHKDGDVLQNN